MKSLMTAAVILAAFAVSAKADVTLAEKRSDLIERKLVISGDKMQYKRRVSQAGAEQAGRTTEQAGKMLQNTSRNVRNIRESNKDKNEGLSLGGIMRGQLKKGDEIRRKRLEMLESSQNPSDRKEAERMKAEMARVEAGGQSDAEQELSDDKIAATKEKAEQHTSAESLEIETVRFDKGKIFKVKPAELSYSEEKISGEKKRREEQSRQTIKEGKDLESSVKDTGKTEKIGDSDCKIYEASLIKDGAPFVTDTLWIAEAPKGVVKEFWQALRRYIAEVGIENTGDNRRETLLASNKGYWDKLAALPGIPLKRIIKMPSQDMGAKMKAGMAAKGMSEAQMAQFMGMMNMAKADPGAAAEDKGVTIELTLLSTDAVDPKEFELPEGLKKK